MCHCAIAYSIILEEWELGCGVKCSATLETNISVTDMKKLNDQEINIIPCIWRNVEF